MMKEIRVHARAGQGAITTATIMANAAFEDGKHALTFPTFGAARMGAPMNAFVRIGDEPIRVRSQIYYPDYVLVQDPTLMKGENVVAGLKSDGLMIAPNSLLYFVQGHTDTCQSDMIVVIKRSQTCSHLQVFSGCGEVAKLGVDITQTEMVEGIGG